ncbi:MAG: hypothetical protein PHQ57_04820 [Candidatus Omnitrophica bacterium]|nr:hypothetical protein [Candidatus Omnitrophota bacterium]
MKKRILKIISIAIALLLGIAFIAKFGLSSLLRVYIEAGIGNCQKIPILCMAPTEEIANIEIDKGYAAELVPYEFPKMTVSMQKGFNVVQEMVKKVYYKKNKRLYNGSIIYVLYQEPNFFVELFPQLKKYGVTDNYEFIKRVMYAKVTNIANINDAFFVIMKGIFTPDLGQQRDVRMAKFMVGEKRGFINYNFSNSGSYFDCNVVEADGGFFKLYIKDKGAQLDLTKVLTIIAKIENTKLN